MIERLFNYPHVLHQTADSESDLPETPIAGHIDNGDRIILSQEGRDIVINQATVPELCKLLKILEAKARGKK